MKKILEFFKRIKRIFILTRYMIHEELERRNAEKN